MKTKEFSFPLKPLNRRKKGRLGNKYLLAALTKLDERNYGEAFLRLLGKDEGFKTLIKNLHSKKNASDVQLSLNIAKALYLSRRFSRVDYLFHISVVIEDIQMDRFSDGVYDFELNPIERAMDRIKKKNGLHKNQFFRSNKAPVEYTKLDNQYGEVMNRNLITLFREYGFDDLADFLQHDSTEFYRLRERGRRNLFNSSDLQSALRELVIKYEIDAKKAAGVGAYYAAIVLLGAGIEGLLLLRCLRSKQKALRAATSLPRRLKNRATQPIPNWSFELLIEVCSKAGWLSKIKTSNIIYLSAGIAHYLRHLRNLVHPSLHAQESPWSEIEHRDYEDADAMYTILLNTLLIKNKKIVVAP